MKPSTKFPLFAGLVLVVCIGVGLWRRGEPPQESNASSQAASEQLPLTVTTRQSIINSTTSEAVTSGPNLMSSEKLHQVLFSAPYEVPQRRVANEFLGPDDLRTYAESVLLMVANKANGAFGFSPTPINPSNGTYRAKCYEGGIEGVFGMNRRHMVSLVHNELEIYADHWFREQVFRDPIRLEALSREPNYLTSEGARDIADLALKSLGMDEAKLAGLSPPVVRQQTWKDRNNQLLPVFVVVYPTKPSPEEHRDYLFRFDIMGIVPGGFVSEFHNATYGDEKFLQIPLAPGYREKAREFVDSPAGKKLR